MDEQKQIEELKKKLYQERVMTHTSQNARRILTKRRRQSFVLRMLSGKIRSLA